MNSFWKRFTSMLVAAGLILGAAASPFSGNAQALEPVAPQADAKVKVAHLAPFADTLEGTSVTVRVNGADALTDFVFNDITGYLDFTPGDYDIEILPTGTSTVAISGTVTVEADTSYSLAAIGNGAQQPLELFAMVDDTMAASSGAKLRIAHLAPFAADLEATKVDICTDEGDIAAGLSGIPYKAFTDPYLELPAGNYNLKITAAGSSCATTLLDLPSVRLMEGEIYDVIAIGDGANQPVQITSTTGLDLTPARVQVAHFAPFADTLAGTSVTVRVNGADALTDFVFNDITDYLDFAPGDYDIEILPTGTSTVAISGTVTVEGGMAYTLAAIGNGDKQPLELFALVDETQPANEAAKLRIAHLAPFADDLAATRVDICTDEGAVAAGLTNIPYKGFTDPYLQLPAGDYDLMIAAPGGTCDTMLLDLPSVRLEAGAIYDVFAIGDLENQPLQITSTTGLTLTPARVKVAHFASFADSIGGTSVTVRVNGADALENFTFGDITDYLELPAGEELQIQILPTGSSTAAISGTFTLDAGMEYTLAAIGDGTNHPLELFPLVDDNEPAEAGARVRIVHLAPFAADLEDTRVDICTQDGSVVPGLTGIPYKAATDPYVELPAGLYDLKVTAAGSDCATTLIDLPALRLFNGQVASVFAAGDGANLAPTAFVESYAMPHLIFAPSILRNSPEN